MAPASERLLSQAPAEIGLGPPDHAPAGSARSHLGNGTCVSWLPRSAPAGTCFAVDAELADRPVPPGLSRWAGRPGPEDFWERWTRVETCCKLRDVPVAVWLRRWGLVEDPSVPLVTFRHGGVVVTCGAVPVAALRTRRCQP